MCLRRPVLDSEGEEIERLVTVQSHKSLWHLDSMLARGALQARLGDQRKRLAHGACSAAQRSNGAVATAWDRSVPRPLVGVRVGQEQHAGAPQARRLPPRSPRRTMRPSWGP